MTMTQPAGEVLPVLHAAAPGASPQRAPPVAPGRVPLLGHLPALLRGPLAFMEALLPIADVVRIDLGPRSMYVVTSLDLVHTLLVAKADDFRRGVIFEKAKKVLGDGLTVLDGEFHRTQRKMIQPVLMQRQVDRYSVAMIALAEAKVGSWRGSAAVDVNRLMKDLGMEMFSCALFRTTLAAADARRVQQATPSFMAGIVAHSLYPAAWFEKLPLPVNRRFAAARRQMADAVDRIIATYRANGRSEDEPAILGMLMDVRNEQGAGMDDGQLRDELINLVVAGAEAPGTTLAWLFHELSQHPDVEEGVMRELAAEIGDGPLTIDNLKGLFFTRNVIKETIRLHTPTWLLTREAVRETGLGGFRIPAGAEVAFSLTAMHRHAAAYDHPGSFDPLRWQDGRTANLPPSAFMPFLVGKHRCLGEFFSAQTMLIAVVTIMRRWRLAATPGSRIREQCVALVQAQGLTMRLSPRGAAAPAPSAA